MAGKFKGVVGIAAAADATTKVAPAHYLQCASASFDDDPIVAVRDSIGSPDPYGADSYGHQHKFSIEGIELPCEHLGYLLWLFCGSDTYQAGDPNHSVVSVNNSKYACIQLMLNSAVDLGSSAPTQVALGARIESFKLDIPKKGFAKMSISGPFADLDAPEGVLMHVQPTGADEAPFSWKALQDASGFVKLGYDGASASADTEIQAIRIEGSREMNVDDGVDLGSDQPTSIPEGKRVVTWEVDKQFSGNAATAYASWLAQELLELDIKGIVGTHDARILIGSSEFAGGYAKEIGASADSVMATISGRAHRNDGAEALLSAFINDAAGAIYS